MLVEFLDDHCMLENKKVKDDNSEEPNIVSAFDFVYLPIDFRYAYMTSFIWLFSVSNVKTFYSSFNAALAVTKDTHSLTSPTHGQCGNFTSPLTGRHGDFSIPTRYGR